MELWKHPASLDLPSKVISSAEKGSPAPFCRVAVGVTVVSFPESKREGGTAKRRGLFFSLECRGGWRKTNTSG